MAFAAAWFFGIWPFAATAAPTEAASYVERVEPIGIAARGQAVKAQPVALETSDGRPADSLPPVTPVDPAPDAKATLQLSTEDIVTRSLPAVVTVETSAGAGSGFFVSIDTVITNAHVVRSAAVVTLRSSGGATSTATVVSSSPDLDLAVLKVQTVNPDQPALALAESSDIRIGAEVVAIGSPLGLRNTVTRGIVSGMRDSKGVILIQTDAAINPGNSGGPLIDRYGRVIGVNTLKLAGETEAIGFAVSVNHARTILGDGFTAPSSAAAVTARRLDFSFRKYDEAVLTLAQRADSVEVEWRKFKPQCSADNAEVMAPREWFALADGVDLRIKPLNRCESWMPIFNDWARRTKSALAMYESTAVNAGVPPERLREVREKYNMSWAAWRP